MKVLLLVFALSPQTAFGEPIVFPTFPACMAVAPVAERLMSEAKPAYDWRTKCIILNGDNES